VEKGNSRLILATRNGFRKVRAIVMPSHRHSALLMVLLAGLCACETVTKFALTTMSPLGWNAQTRIELPLVVDASRRPLIRTQIKGQDALALLDTGANFPAVSPALADATGAKKATLGKGKDKEDVLEDVPVQLGPASIKLGYVRIGDMSEGELLVLGFAVFSQAIVEINFDTSRLTLVHPDAFTPPEGPALRVKTMHGVPTVDLKIDGHAKPVCTIIDTGTNAGLVLSTDVVDELALPRNPAFSAKGEGFDGKQMVATGLAQIGELRIGDHLFRNVPAMEVPPRVLHGRERCDSILGMALLSRYNLVLDMKKQRMWLLPRSSVR
jgi:predicted aspartyl protease